LSVRGGDAVALEGEAVAGIGVGEEGGDVGHDAASAFVALYGAGDAFVADVIGNNATLRPAISSPYDGPPLLFGRSCGSRPSR